MSNNCSENFESLLIQCVDLDEKNNKELGEILNLLDDFVQKFRSEISEKLLKKIITAEKNIEKIILKEIEPIVEEDTFINSIYELLESISKGIKKKQLVEDSSDDQTFDNSQEETSSIDLEKVIEEEEGVDEVLTITEEPVITSEDKSEPDITSEPDVLKEESLSEQDDEIFLDFIQEIKEYIDTLEDEIINLERNPKDKSIINEIFRPFHTLKGVSGFLGLKKLNIISHETETLLELARTGKIQVTQAIIDAVLLSIDTIKFIVSTLNVKDKKEDIEEEKVSSIVKLLNKLSEKALAQDEEVSSQELYEETEEIDADDLKVKSEKKIQDTAIKIKTDKLDSLIDMVGELVIIHNVLKEDKNILSIRDHNFLKKFSQFSRTVGELQKSSTSLRMIPIASTFQKMKRVVRDYSKKNNKPINLVFKGEDTEIDRNIVDSLYDPLVHMVRNSCDHGIENKDLRLERSKDSTGTIILDAYHKGNNFVLEIKDDGNGLNKERIYQKALQNGLVDKDKNLTDNEIFKFIFEPGFSTAAKVTNVSGRGVGLDVVNQSLKTLGGRIEIESEQYKGSSFKIVLPLTLAIIEGMLVKVGSELYILPIVNVVRSFKPQKADINYILGKGETVKVDDSLIPVVKLYEVFKIDDAVKELDEALLILIRDQNKKFALVVDRLIGIQDVVVKSLGRKFRNLKGVSGATILGDGQVGLILDTNSLKVGD